MAIYTELNSEVMKKHNKVSFSGPFGIYTHTYVCVCVCVY